MRFFPSFTYGLLIGLGASALVGLAFRPWEPSPASVVAPVSPMAPAPPGETEDSPLQVDFDMLAANRGKYSGKFIAVNGRVYTSGGGSYKLIRSIRGEDLEGFAILLGSWPFGGLSNERSLSPYVTLTGRFTAGDDEIGGFLAGPRQIWMTPPPSGREEDWQPQPAQPNPFDKSTQKPGAGQ